MTCPDFRTSLILIYLPLMYLPPSMSIFCPPPWGEKPGNQEPGNERKFCFGKLSLPFFFHTANFPWIPICFCGDQTSRCRFCGPRRLWHFALGSGDVTFWPIPAKEPSTMVDQRFFEDTPPEAGVWLCFLVPPPIFFDPKVNQGVGPTVPPPLGGGAPWVAGCNPPSLALKSPWLGGFVEPQWWVGWSRGIWTSVHLTVFGPYPPVQNRRV